MADLTPKSLHYIAFAMQFGSEPDKAIWAAVDRDTSKDLPPAAVRAALNALHAYEGKIHARLDTDGISEDDAAEFSDILGTVQSIQRGLKRYQERQRAFAEPMAAA